MQCLGGRVQEIRNTKNKENCTANGHRAWEKRRRFSKAAKPGKARHGRQAGEWTTVCFLDTRTRCGPHNRMAFKSSRDERNNKLHSTHRDTKRQVNAVDTEYLRHSLRFADPKMADRTWRNCYRYRNRIDIKKQVGNAEAADRFRI